MLHSTFVPTPGGLILSAPQAALGWAELMVAVLTILGVGYGVFRAFVRSFSKGYIDKYIFAPRRKAKTAHEQVDEVQKKVDHIDKQITEIGEHGQTRTDALIALGEAINSEKEFDVDEFANQADDRSVDRFLAGDDD